MTERSDILTDNYNDLKIQGGDLVVADSNEQHISDLLIAERGHYKQAPRTGAGIKQLLNGSLTAVEKRKLRLQLKADGYEAMQMSLKNNTFKISV